MNITIKECRNCKSTPFVDYDSKQEGFVLGCPNLGCNTNVFRKDFYSALRIWNHDNNSYARLTVETRHTF